MTLLELIKTYKGKSNFDVDTLEDGESKDSINFTNSEVDAVKEDLISSEVVRYSVTSITSGVPTIEVVVRKNETVQEEPTGQEAEVEGQEQG